MHTVFSVGAVRPRPLTAAELVAIFDAEPTATIWRLMHEIHHLRAVVCRADQIRKLIGPRHNGSVTDAVWAAFEEELDAEPCLTDPPTSRQQARVDRILERCGK